MENLKENSSESEYASPVARDEDDYLTSERRYGLQMEESPKHNRIFGYDVRCNEASKLARLPETSSCAWYETPDGHLIG